jgi:hypothetical protein
VLFFFSNMRLSHPSQILTRLMVRAALCAPSAPKRAAAQRSNASALRAART